MRHNTEKRRLETEAIRLFITLINARRESTVRLLYQRERPDAVLEETKTRAKFGVEITHLYYNENEAKHLLGRSALEVFGPEIQDQMLIELNGRIARKEATFGSVAADYPISLLIRNASPAYSLTQFVANANRITRSHHIFRDIWLLTRDGLADWHLYRLPEEAVIS